MIGVRIVERPAFEVIGVKTWISGQDNDLFGRFWQQCAQDGSLHRLEQIRAGQVGPQTGGVVLGVSCVEKNPANRAFHYLIGIEKPADWDGEDLERYWVPASQWAVFACHGQMPSALVRAEMFAFGEWLPSSLYVHALAPEMEVYLPQCAAGEGEIACEFWLPIDLEINVRA